MSDFGGSDSGRRSGGNRGKRGSKGRSSGARTVTLRRTTPIVREPITLPPVMTVADLATKIETTPIEIIKELMKIGIMANINQQIDYDSADRVAVALGWETSEDIPEIVQKANANFESRVLEALNDP